jgi:hypothetical protein
MKYARAIFVTLPLLGIATILGAAEEVRPRPPIGITNPPPVYLNKSLFIERDKIAPLKSQANHGDGLAAYNLAIYYGFVVKSQSEELHWAAVSAKTGYAEGEYLLGQIFAISSKSGDRNRAIYWLTRAKKSGMIGCEGVKYAGCIGGLEELKRTHPH